MALHFLTRCAGVVGVDVRLPSCSVLQVGPTPLRFEFGHTSCYPVHEGMCSPTVRFELELRITIFAIMVDVIVASVLVCMRE
jgi:hypothetical protein